MQRYVDSFDLYSIADILTRWTLLSGTITIGSGTGRNTNCLRLQNGLSSFATVTKLLDNQPTFITGFAWNYTSAATTSITIVQFLDGTTIQCDVRINANRTFSVTRNGTVLATSVDVMPLGAFNYIEFKATIDNTVGSYELRLNGVTILSGTGVDTQTTVNSYANSVKFGGSTFGIPEYQLDDLYIFDGTGTHNNDFAGDVVIGAYSANAAGDLTEWDPSAGSNYQCIDEMPSNGDSDYISTNVIGERDLFNFSSLSGAATSILGIQRTIIARKDDAGTRIIKPLYKGGGTVYSGSTVSLGTSYGAFIDTMELDPATGLPWTTPNVNAAQFGVELDT